MTELISRELYEAAGENWAKARERVTSARAELKAAEDALTKAEETLTGQEAYPGIPAWWHVSVPADRCRIGYSCRIHAGQDPWTDEEPF